MRVLDGVIECNLSWNPHFPTTANVFETFRDVCITNYEFDPAWYYTAPGLAWDAALKMTKVELELLTDIEMLDMFEKGIRGGISSIMHRHGKAKTSTWEKTLTLRTLVST